MGGSLIFIFLLADPNNVQGQPEQISSGPVVKKMISTTFTIMPDEDIIFSAVNFNDRPTHLNFTCHEVVTGLEVEGWSVTSELSSEEGLSTTFKNPYSNEVPVYCIISYSAPDYPLPNNLLSASIEAVNLDNGGIRKADQWRCNAFRVEIGSIPSP